MARYESIGNSDIDDDMQNLYSTLIDDNIDINNNLASTLNNLTTNNILISLSFNINDIITEEISKYLDNSEIENKVNDLLIDKKIKDDIDISIKKYCNNTTK